MKYKINTHKKRKFYFKNLFRFSDSLLFDLENIWNVRSILLLLDFIAMLL